MPNHSTRFSTPGNPRLKRRSDTLIALVENFVTALQPSSTSALCALCGTRHTLALHAPGLPKNADASSADLGSVRAEDAGGGAGRCGGVRAAIGFLGSRRGSAGGAGASGGGLSAAGGGSRSGGGGGGGGGGGAGGSGGGVSSSDTGTMTGSG